MTKLEYLFQGYNKRKNKRRRTLNTERKTWRNWSISRLPLGFGNWARIRCVRIGCTLCNTAETVSHCVLLNINEVIKTTSSFGIARNASELLTTYRARKQAPALPLGFVACPSSADGSQKPKTKKPAKVNIRARNRKNKKQVEKKENHNKK